MLPLAARPGWLILVASIALRSPPSPSRRRYALHRLRFRHLPRCVRRTGHARGVLRRGVDRALRRGRGGAGRRRGQCRRDPQGCGRRHQAAGARGSHRRRQAQGRDRPRRLPHRRHRAPTRQAMRRCRALRALGRDHPGHHGHRHGAADARRAGARRRRPGGARCGARGAGRQAPRHRDGGPHASAARPARDLRLQGGRLARHDRPAPRASDPAAALASWSASSPARPARWPRSATRALPCTTR